MIRCDRCGGLCERDLIVTVWADAQDTLLCDICHDDVAPYRDPNDEHRTHGGTL